MKTKLFLAFTAIMLAVTVFPTAQAANSPDEKKPSICHGNSNSPACQTTTTTTTSTTTTEAPTTTTTSTTTTTIATPVDNVPYIVPPQHGNFVLVHRPATLGADCLVVLWSPEYAAETPDLGYSGIVGAGASGAYDPLFGTTDLFLEVWEYPYTYIDANGLPYHENFAPGEVLHIFPLCLHNNITAWGQYQGGLTDEQVLVIGPEFTFTAP